MDIKEILAKVDHTLLAQDATWDQIRAICAEAAVLPNEAARRVFIICDAQLMNIQAQNAFLKTLEEPPSHVSFLLLTNNPGRLLETVRSRCAQIIMTPAGAGQAAADAEADSFLTTLLTGDPLSMAEAIFSLEKMDKQRLSVFFSAVRTAAAAQVRGVGSDSARLAAVIAAMDEGDRYLDANINAGSIAGLFLARLL